MTVFLSAGAQDTNFTITGKITDAENNQSLPGAHIQIEETFLAAVSGLNGRFSFKNLKQGEVVLIVSYVGYETLRYPVLIPVSGVIDIMLHRKVYTSEEVIISATRADAMTPTTQQNISGDQIREGSTGQDIPMLLSLTPSMVTTSDAGAGIGYTGLRIRGTDIERINVTINGVPLNDPESNGVYWVNLPDLASSVDHIQIQRGVGTSSNGAAAFGGSINIQTNRNSALPFAEIYGNAGSFNSFSSGIRFGTGLIENKWAFDGRLSAITSDGYIDRAFTHLKSFNVNAGYYGSKNIVRLTILGGNEKTYQAWGGVPKDSLQTNRTFNPYTYENETDNYEQFHFHLNFMRQQNDKLSINATAFLVTGKGYYEQYKEERKFSAFGLEPLVIGVDTFERTDAVQQKHLDNIFTGFNSIVHYNSHRRLSITGGLAFSYYVNDHFGKIIWMQYAADVPKDYQWYINSGEKTEVSAFAKSSFLITENISVFGDILYRYLEYDMNGIHDDLRDLTQSHLFNFINPKGGIYAVLSSKHDCYASVAVAQRDPGRNSFRDADPGVTVLPEMLVDYEVGYQLKLKKLLLNANLFYMDYKDQLVMTGEINNVGDPILVNVSESYRAGIELVVHISLMKKLQLDANLSLSRNKILDFTEYVDNWDTWGQDSRYLGETDISFSPSVVGGAELKYNPLKGLVLAISSKYVGKQFIDNTSSDDRALDPWLVNNVRVSWNFSGGLWKNLELKLMIFNVFDEQYESNAWVYRYVYGGSEYVSDGYFPQAGRHFMVGLSLNL